MTKESLKDFVTEIEALSIDDLHSLRMVIAKEHSHHSEAIFLLRRKLDTIKNVMFIKKNGGSIGVTDHAVLRYLERHKGVDVRGAREEIQKLISIRKPTLNPDTYDANGITLVISPAKVVATLFPTNNED